MEFRQLQYFIAVAENLNFTKAGQQLYVEQSAVSQQISKLEQELGVKLFDRNKHYVRLTNAGKVLLKEAQNILENVDDAIQQTLKAQAGIKGSLTIGFLVAPVRSFLPTVIKEFSKKYPEVLIKLRHLSLAHLNDHSKADDLDIVFTISFDLEKITGLEYKVLFTESPAVFMHRDHPLANRERIHLSELSKEPFIFRNREVSPQWYDHTLMLCTENGFSPNIVNMTERVEAALLLVDAGIGVAIFPRYLEMYASSKLSIINIAGKKNTIDVVYYINKNNTNPSIPLFLEELELVLNNLV